TVRTVQDPQFPGALLNQSWKDIIATAVDASHVRFALPGHNAGFLANLELLDIVPSHLLAGKSIAELASASPNLNPVGTGPFRMVANLGDRIQLERNPFSWRRPWLDSLMIRSFSSQAAALDALDRGQIDGLANLTPSGAAQARANTQVASQLSEVGIVAEVRPVTTASLIHDYLNPRTFDMTLTAFDNGPDPDVYSFWHSSQAHPGGFNFAGMKKNVFIDGDLEDGRNTL